MYEKTYITSRHCTQWGERPVLECDDKFMILLHTFILLNKNILQVRWRLRVLMKLIYIIQFVIFVEPGNYNEVLCMFRFR